MMNTQRKYRCRKCGIDMPAGLAANAEGTRRANAEQDLLKHLRMRPYSNPSFWMLAAADEIECLRGLAVRAWHSFRSGLTATGGCTGGLTDGDILELAKLSNAECAKLREHSPA